MKRFLTIKTLILVFTLLLGIIPVSATERPYAANGNGQATFITMVPAMLSVRPSRYGVTQLTWDHSPATEIFNSFLTPTIRPSRIRRAMLRM